MKGATRSQALAGLLVRAALLAVAVGALALCLVKGRYELGAKRIATVTPGQIYRGAAQRGLPYERFLRERRIKTILNLLPPDADVTGHAIEREVAGRLGVEIESRPMGDLDVGDWDLIEEVSALLAEEDRQPIFVHCHAGVHRTGVMVVLHRVHAEGWTIHDALDEMDRRGGKFHYDPWIKHMLLDYHEQRVRQRLRGGNPVSRGSRR